MNGLVLSMSRKKGLPGNKIILLEKRSSSLGSTKTTPHPRASPQEYWHSDLTASMAAIEHESFAEDEILRRADELKKAVNEANTRDKIPAFDRSALDTQEWRPVVLECMELLVWRLLDEHGEVLDEGGQLGTLLLLISTGGS